MEAASGTSPTRPNIMASKCSSRDGGGHGEEERHVQAHTRSHGGSPWSDAAVAYAIRLAAGTDAEVCILSVLTIPVSYDTPEAGMEFDMLIDSVEQEGKERLLRAATYATRVGVASIILLKWGNIPATILQTADAEACDLIILGSRGLTGWKRLMLGSISNVVAAKASQPVLIVKQHSAGAPDAPLWRRVLVATGDSAWSEAAVEHAVRLAHAEQLEVCFLHVARTRGPRGDTAAAFAGQESLVRAEARAAAAGLVYDATLGIGDIVRTILDTAATKQCDAIVMGSRGLTGWKRLMLGSIAGAVAATAVLPVLIVKHSEPTARTDGRATETPHEL
jgi:nucleotide-binding universal stress UspA family protein